MIFKSTYTTSQITFTYTGHEIDLTDKKEQHVGPFIPMTVYPTGDLKNNSNVVYYKIAHGKPS